MLSSFAGMAPTYSSINSTSLHDALPIYRFLGHPSGQVATVVLVEVDGLPGGGGVEVGIEQPQLDLLAQDAAHCGDRNSTRLNSSHVAISYAVFCLNNKINN